MFCLHLKVPLWIAIAKAAIMSPCKHACFLEKQNGGNRGTWLCFR